MKINLANNVLFFAVAFALAHNAYAGKAEDDLANKGYAEALYADFSKYASGEIQFKIRTLHEASGKELAKQTFVGALGYPVRSLDLTADATRIWNVSFTDNPSKLDFESTTQTFEQYDDLGLPIARAVPRFIEVVSTIGKSTDIHSALELCWAEQDYCTVIDLTMPQILTEVRNIRRLRAEGYRTEIKKEAEAKTTYDCHISGDYSKNKLPYYRAAYQKTILRTNGEKGLDLTVGKLDFGIACSTSTTYGACEARPYIYTSEGTNVDRKYPWWWSAKCPTPVTDSFNGSYYPNSQTATSYAYNGCAYSGSTSINLTAVFTQRNLGQVNADASLTTNGQIFNSGSRVSGSCSTN